MRFNFYLRYANLIYIYQHFSNAIENNFSMLKSKLQKYIRLYCEIFYSIRIMGLL